MAKIVTLSVPFPGAKRPLEEGKKLGMWEFIPLEGARVDIPPADVYILAAWHPVYERLLGLGKKVGILWTSSGGEMDLEPVEQTYLEMINRDPRVSFIWFGDIALARIYPQKGFYAPYPFDVDGVNPLGVEKKNIATLFCPTGPKKNVLNQLLAMRLVQQEKRWVLHTNVTGYDYLLNKYAPGALDCVRHGWLPEEEYHNLLASARVNLACSWAETFNYGVAEAGLLGTISVVSHTIPLPGLQVAHLNNPIHIAERVLLSESYSLKDIIASMQSKLEFNNHEVKRILPERQIPYGICP